jgi:predicted nicotinamide N-methyase
MASIIHNNVPGGWSDRSITIGPHQIRLFTPTHPDALLEKLESPEASTNPHFADPYWAKLWPAAPLLAAAIVLNPPPRGTRVLELGCGSGLVGIAALACGLDVIFSDYVPLAVNLALENANRNRFTNAKGLVLDWRSFAEASARGSGVFGGGESSNTGDRFPPKTPDPFHVPFPLIVAADVTYDRTNLLPLLSVVDRLLAPSGQAWFGDAGRSPLPEFLKLAVSRGWNVSLFDEHDRPSEAPTLGTYQRVVLQRRETVSL